MHISTIQKLVFSAPFRAFTLTMNNGRAYYVRHPELILVAPGHVFVIDEQKSQGIYLEPSLIASMQPDEAPEG